MHHFNPQAQIPPSVLASDLDGTLIPLPKTPENNEDLIRLERHFSTPDKTLVYATGRHFESVIEVMHSYQLPRPEWIVCDVGTAIYQRKQDRFEIFSKYESELAKTSDGLDRAVIEQMLLKIDGLQLQSPEHQQRFKISYESSAEKVDALVDRINAKLETATLPYSCMGSVDPFLNRGLLDVMPAGVSKAYALLWLSTHANFTPDEVIYAGDSGNDYRALISGFRAIVVANASPGLAAKAKASLQKRALADRLYFAQSKATSGVLEGCRHFGLF